LFAKWGFGNQTHAEFCELAHAIDFELVTNAIKGESAVTINELLCLALTISMHVFRCPSPSLIPSLFNANHIHSGIRGTEQIRAGITTNHARKV
jgi:hypothetical protein